jgi:hypothetical protein
VAAKGGRRRWADKLLAIKAQLAVKLWPGMATSTRCILKKII